jgi:hypothetical protein
MKKKPAKTGEPLSIIYINEFVTVEDAYHVHEVRPALHSDHLEYGQHANTDVVECGNAKVHVGSLSEILPSEVEAILHRSTTIAIGWALEPALVIVVAAQAFN